MSDFGTIVFAAVGVVVIVLALRVFARFRWHTPQGTDDLRTQKDERGNTVFVRCPLCDTPLAKRDNLASRIFRPMDTPDQRMVIMGCPHCFPAPGNDIRRTCPVCHRAVPSDGYLVARLFNHAGNKKHVIVTGCSEEAKK